ncbi:hypothetical protein BH20ACI4_BH20ACI4_27270 [soil metagenome]
MTLFVFVFCESVQEIFLDKLFEDFGKKNEKNNTSDINHTFHGFSVCR